MKHGVAGLLIVMLFAVTTPANGATVDYYGKTTKVVAAELKCAKSHVTTSRPGESRYFFMSGKCQIGHTRVGFATFRGPSRQAKHRATVMAFLEKFYPPGNYYFASGEGVFIQTKQYTRRGAMIAKRRLGATVTKVHVVGRGQGSLAP